MNYPRTSSPQRHDSASRPPSTPVLFNQDIRPVKPVAWDWQSKPELWAQAVRQQLSAQLQQPHEPGQSPAVELLLAELQVLLAAVLRDSSPAAWYYLYNVLGSLSPYRTLLCGHLDILPFLEKLYLWAPQIQTHLGLDFLEVLRQAFPPDTSLMAPSAHTFCRHQKLRSLSSPVSFSPPCPFVQAEQRQRQKDKNEDEKENWVYPVTLSELQYALGIVRVDMAQDEAFWMNGLGLLPLALATDIPIKYVNRKEEEEYRGIGTRHISLSTVEESRAQRPTSAYSPQTILLKNQIISILRRNRYLTQIHFLYLNLATTRHFRPYSLTVVSPDLVKPEHYIFSPFGVLHVHPVDGSMLMTLGTWHRHAMLWQHLQAIPFFKHYIVRKALTCWRKNVRLQILKKRRDFLRNNLLFAIPHFGICLLHINRLLQELHSVPWLPQEENRCYTLPELQLALSKMNRGALRMLQRCLHLTAAVLQLVHEDTYRMRQGLQERVESFSEYSSAKGSMYRKWFHRQQLMQKLNRAERWWQYLGCLARLVDYMTCQNLVSILENEMVTFVTYVLQAPRQVALLTGKLVFSEEGKLLVVPSAEQMAQSLNEWLNAVVISALTVMKSSDHQTPVNPSQASDETLPIEEEDEEELDPAFISLVFRAQPNEAVRIFCGPETEMVHSRRADPSVGPLEMVGHRIRAQYALPNRIQLQNDLDTNKGIQKSLAIQQALLEDMLSEVKTFCKDHKWLRSIHQFLKNWGLQKVENITSWPTMRYKKLFSDLKSWQSRMSGVPTMLLTKNMILALNCNCVQTDIVSQLADIKKDVLTQLSSVRNTQSQELINELSDFIQVLQSISIDIQTIAKCFQKLTEANEKREELEKRVEYVCALNNIVRSQFGKLTSEEEELEIVLLDMWKNFLFERLQASEFLLNKQSNLVPQLQEMIAAALQQLEDLSTQAVSDPFMDTTQEHRSTERQLINMERTYVSISSRLAELHHAYVILSGDKKSVPVTQKGLQPILLQQQVWHLFGLIKEQIGEWKCLAFSKIWLSENEHFKTQESLRKLQQTWEGRQLRLLNFILCVPYEPPPSEHSKRHSHYRDQEQQLEVVAKDASTCLRLVGRCFAVKLIYSTSLYTYKK